MVVFLYETAEGIPVCAISSIAQEFHVSEAFVGTLLAWYWIVASVVTVPLVWLTTRWSRRNVLAFILICLLLSQVMSACAIQFWILVVSRLLCAFTHGLMWSVIAPIAIRLVPPAYAGRATTAIYTGSNLSLVFGDPSVVAISAHWGWRLVPGIVAGVAGIALVVSRLVLPACLPRFDSASPQGEQVCDHRISLGKQSRSLLGLNIVTFIAVTAHFISYTFIIVVIRDIFHVDDSGQVWFLVLFGLAGLVSVPLLARPLDHYPRLVTVMCLGSLAIGFIVLLGIGKIDSVLAHSHLLIGTLIVNGIAIIIWGSSSTALSPVLQSVVMRVAPDNPDQASSWFVIAFQTGIIIGSLLGGGIYDHFGILAVIGCSSLLSIAAGLSFWAWRPQSGWNLVHSVRVTDSLPTQSG